MRWRFGTFGFLRRTGTLPEECLDEGAVEEGGAGTGGIEARFGGIFNRYVRSSVRQKEGAEKEGEQEPAMPPVKREIPFRVIP